MDATAAKEEIRERVDLVDLVSQYVELKQAGRNWKGLCPFHQEKTPSFNVNRETRFWKCFGCGAAGDVFTFVQRVENIGFPEAMKLLGDRIGVTWEATPAQRESRDEREQILHANEMAAEWFRAQLRSHPGAPARAYLDRRGLDSATVERFRLGYAPGGWDALLSYLGSRGISPERAIRAGLARASDRGGAYDVFRNRVMFPITDVLGRVIAFGGRALDPEEPAKYINSPETLVFRKGRTFYGLDAARKAIADEGFAVVVEGYMDVVGLAQHGVNHCVAALGTALTEQHAAILARYTPEICLVFDDDEAGMQAALRSIRVFENCPAGVKVAPLSGGKDPDDYVREFGREGFGELLKSRIGLVEYRIRLIFSQQATTGPEGRAKAAQEVVEVLSDVPNIARRQALLAWAADEWAGTQPDRDSRFERALLEQMHRRAQEKAPTKRDEWERVLADRGVPSAVARQQARRLARAEWLEQVRRREALLVSVTLARAAGLTPTSAHSPVSADFITETLARGDHPVVRSAYRRERRMLTAMLADADTAERVLARLAPTEFLLPVHRELAQVIAEGLAAGEGGGIAERLAGNEELLAAAAEIAVAEEGYDEQQVEQDALLIREAQVLGGKGLRLYNVEPKPLASETPGETLADVEEQVHELMRSEGASSEDPTHQRWLEIQRRVRGKGTREYWDYH
jgi:DNA primase